MPHSPPFSQLSALSPLDGRYHKQLEPLRACFSEAALFRHRIAIELRWLLALAAEPAIAEIKPFSKDTSAVLESVIATFSKEDAAQVKAIEAETNHDVKAIEIWLKKRLASNPEAARVAEFVHFACTSEDINNLAYGLMLKGGRDRVLLPALDRVVEALAALDRVGVPHREDERRGGQLQRAPRRVPELRLGAFRPGVRRIARAGIQSLHHPDRAARQPRRAVRRDRAREHGAPRPRPRSVGLRVARLFQTEGQSG